MNCSASSFIQDNITGNRVVKAHQRKDGGFSYEMESGWTNILSREESEKLRRICGRTGFQIRMKGHTNHDQ